MKTAEQIRLEGRQLTTRELTAIGQKFRAIGGAYELVAAAIEQQHPHARPDATLPSDEDFADWLASLNPAAVLYRHQVAVLYPTAPTLHKAPSQVRIEPVGISLDRALEIACAVYDAKVARGETPKW